MQYVTMVAGIRLAFAIDEGCGIDGVLGQVHAETDQGPHRAVLVRGPKRADRLQRIEPTVGLGQPLAALARLFDLLQRILRRAVDRLDRCLVEAGYFERL